MILDCVERFVPPLSPVYIPGLPESAILGSREMGPASGGFEQVCLQWGIPDVDLMVSMFNRKVSRFLATVALVAPWSYYSLVYALPPLKLLPPPAADAGTRRRTHDPGGSNWPRREWFASFSIPRFLAFLQRGVDL